MRACRFLWTILSESEVLKEWGEWYLMFWKEWHKKLTIEVLNGLEKEYEWQYEGIFLLFSVIVSKIGDLTKSFRMIVKNVNRYWIK